MNKNLLEKNMRKLFRNDFLFPDPLLLNSTTVHVRKCSPKQKYPAACFYACFYA